MEGSGLASSHPADGAVGLAPSSTGRPSRLWSAGEARTISVGSTGGVGRREVRVGCLVHRHEWDRGPSVSSWVEAATRPCGGRRAPETRSPLR